MMREAKAPRERLFQSLLLGVPLDEARSVDHADITAGVHQVLERRLVTERAAVIASRSAA
jgi:hypothetical protein